MAAAGLAAFDELRERLAELGEARGRRAGAWSRLPPTNCSALPPEERHRVYKMTRLKVAPTPNGDIGMRGEVLPVSKNGAACRRG